VFVAKPLALTSTEARRYLAARKQGVVVTAGQLASAWQPWPTMLRLASEGRVGRLLTMRASHQHFHYAGFPDQLWYADPSEGDLCNWLGWYPVEALVAALGPIAQVTGVARQAASAHGNLPDHVVGLFELADGRHATANVYFTIGPSWPMPMHEGELVGESGVIRYMGPGNTVQILDDQGAHLVPFDAGPDQLALEFDRFVTAIRGEGEPLLSVEHAVHVAEVCAAWHESTLLGRAVQVPAPPAEP
jgi:predicted dehydrogenase